MDKLEIQKEQIVIKYLVECLRCGNKWFTKLQRPSLCPECHSEVWDKPRTTSKTKKIQIVDLTQQEEKQIVV